MTAGQHPLQTYLEDVAEIRATGAGTKETAYYPALEKLLSEVGRQLKPRVRCVMGLKNLGAGFPDGGLFTEDQFKSGSAQPTTPHSPSRGVIEVKGVGFNLTELVASEQVAKYWAKHRLVLVTDYREFILLGERDGKTFERERHALTPEAKSFWHLAQNPQRAAKYHGGPFVDFLKRTLLHAAPLQDPKDVAWFLASYARDALHRVEHANVPALANLRSALEQALGLKFTGGKGEHFFRSTLIQTLFYGVFAAWVIWQKSGAPGKFDWRSATWTLHVPMINALYAQMVQPARLKPLGLEEPLDHAANALSRVDRGEFFKRFQDRHAVQYFYEPFLQAFDPELRKQLGVWYTPEEIVRYMVRRVDQALVSELGIADGLADPQVYVLDPCCGTGTYLVETLQVIAERLKAKGGDALAAQRLKEAMTERIFGFEVLPAPFVVAHLQIGLLLASQGTPLSEQERASIYLTNALTGWEPAKGPKQHLVFPELEAERDAAEVVKRDKPILVVLGNPPYNAYAGVAQGEEQDLVEPYKRGLVKEWGIKKFNLDELYVRFFRLAERRIAERSGRGIVSFISNHSWVSDPSFVVLRKNLLKSFDRFWIENMHGNRKISEYAPDGRTSETVFAVSGFSPGIRQGVAVSLWVKHATKTGNAEVFFRDDLAQARASDRRAALLASLDDQHLVSHYVQAQPTAANRYSFRPAEVGEAYSNWPTVPELAAISPINGLMEKRGGALISIDRDPLEKRMRVYLDATVNWTAARTDIGELSRDAARFDAEKTRTKVIKTEGYLPDRLRRHAVRPFDSRYCYYSGVRPLWNEPRPSLWAQAWPGNAFVLTRPSGVADPEGVPFMFTPLLGDNDFLRGHAYYIPLRIKEKEQSEGALQASLLAGDSIQPNVSNRVKAYLSNLHVPVSDADVQSNLIWLHVLAIGYSPKYLDENSDGIRQGWPRIPLPSAREVLVQSAEIGRKVAELLNTERPVEGVTIGKVRPELQAIAVITRVGGGSLDPKQGHLALTAGWGYAGRERVTMPGKGRVESRPAELAEALGNQTFDIYLNNLGYWANVPEKVWEYTIGGNQVLKKWLSYRERSLLGRDLTMEEVDFVTSTARRIAALLLMTKELDDNYAICRDSATPLPTENNPSSN